MTTKILIYSKSNCPYCTMAKNWMNNKGLQYTEIVLDNDQERSEFYTKIGEGIRSVPQIFIQNDQDLTRIGGYQELIAQSEQILEMTKDIQSPSSLTADF